MALDDTSLLERARAGDRRALTRLLERHQDRIYRFGMKMCRQPEDAAEVLQDTMLAVARNIRGFRGNSSVSTWLFTIARSYCIKKRRRRKGAPAATESIEADSRAEVRRLASPGRDPESEVLGRELKTVLDEAISSLEPATREVLLLRDVEGLSALEVARILGIGVEAVKSRLHRARLAVRARLAPSLGEAAPSSGCPDITRMLSKHLEGEIDARACARMEQHIAGCDPCAAKCDDLRRVLRTCRAIPAPAIPAPLQNRIRESIRDLLPRA